VLRVVAEFREEMAVRGEDERRIEPFRVVAGLLDAERGQFVLGLASSTATGKGGLPAITGRQSR
jgi:hypothetical protein